MGTRAIRIIERPAGTEWKPLAACLGTDPDIFFPEGTVSPLAKQICGGCPVKEPCLEYALQNKEKFGIWGGTSERERRRIARQRAGKKARP